MIDKSAKWVSADGDCEAPIITGTISAPTGRKQAVISICGLGFFECLINGEKISDDLLVPAWSDYEPRPGRRLLYPLNDTFSYRIYYLDYDITRFLHDGENTIEVWLGNGWYNQHERNAEGDLWYGPPKLAYTVAIEGADGSKQFQHSDERLTWRPGPIVFNNVYLGEKWDDRADRPKAAFPVKVVPAPSSPLYRQTCPPDREIRLVAPKLLGQKEDRRIYDAGADAVTLGNHTFGKMQIRDLLEDEPWLLRPANYTGRSPGRGCGIFARNGFSVRVINLIGRCDLHWGGENPFTTADVLLKAEEAEVTVVDFHAEATSEKLAMGYYLDGRVSALWGTHTHVPTADERVYPKGTGYITDLGMTGPVESVLGIEPWQSVESFLGGLPGRYRSPEGPCKLQGAVFTVDTKTGLCTAVERVDVR